MLTCKAKEACLNVGERWHATHRVIDSPTGWTVIIAKRGG
eukprot:gene1755-9911_t